mgnify:FL=1
MVAKESGPRVQGQVREIPCSQEMSEAAAVLQEGIAVTRDDQTKAEFIEGGTLVPWGPRNSMEGCPNP